MAVLLASCGLLVAQAAHAQTRVIHVRNSEQLMKVVPSAQPGVKIVIHPGTYRGGVTFTNVQGTPERWIWITGSDPDNRPVFSGGFGTLKFTDPAYLLLENLVIQGAADNGLNIDDGGTYDTPAHHVILRNLLIRRIGSGGNNDGIKMSGVDNFRIENCVVEDWGMGDGTGIDMVGCHDGLIIGCTIGAGRPVQTSVGIQAKCGSERITIRNCVFNVAGERAVQMGGRGGWHSFRPQNQQVYEAQHITVEDCVFLGAETPVSFVGARDCVFRYNTIYSPTGYLMRILKEDPEAFMEPTSHNIVEDNLFVFHFGKLRTPFNISGGTKPETFTFARNWWYAMDRPEASRVGTPAPERDGVYGVDPQLRNPEAGDLTPRESSPAWGVGAGARARLLSSAQETDSR